MEVVVAVLEKAFLAASEAETLLWLALLAMLSEMALEWQRCRKLRPKSTRLRKRQSPWHF